MNKKNPSKRITEKAGARKPRADKPQGRTTAIGKPAPGKKKVPVQAATKKKAAAKKKVVTHPLMKNQKAWNQDKTMIFICGEIATSTRSVRTILDDGYEGKKLPAYSNVMLWLSENTNYQDLYARAKEAQTECLAEEMLDIADDSRNDYMDRLDDNGDKIGILLDKEHLARSRLRIETRKWLMGKLKPRKYGERVDLNLGGQPDNPFVILARAVQGRPMMPAKQE